MVVSLSFWLSVGGVFYIFLILHYIKNKKVLLFLIPVLIHILMIPVAHSIFDEVSIYQWSSILFSWIFIPFYPISFILHLIGFGGAFDSILERLWSIPLEFEYKKLSIYFLFLYLFSSILAIRYKFFFFFTIVLAIFCAFYLYL
jgi:competence protein ComEC